MRGVWIGLCLVWSCRREWLPPQAGELRFSRDTVVFDSLFSTLLSPTQRLWVYNPHPFPVVIRSIRLEKAERSPFRFIFDGQPGPLTQPYTLRPRDSAQVFLTLQDTTFVNDTRVDRLLWETEKGLQAVVLRATLIAAYVYRDFGFDSAIVSFPSDKPVVIDGYFYVGPAGVLRILPGTRLFFSGKRWESGPLRGELASGLYIAGRLEALGTPAQPITMQGWRLEPYYATAAGQWQGLWFLPTSHANRLLYTRISQSSIGIRLDSVGDASAPKLYSEGCIIYRAANYGILGLSFAPQLPPQPILRAVNTLIFQCGQACAALVGGGSYQLINCTLIYDQPDPRRGQTALLIGDFYRFPDQTLRTYPLNWQAINSVFWSVKEDAVVVETYSAQPQLSWEFCAFQQKNPLPGPGHLYPRSLEVGPAAEFYPLRAESPLIDRGKNQPGLIPAVDLLGRPRDTQPDIGAYEYLR
ncbi:MAG: hypothetical protein NZ958_05550 [Bacteroidia bacterium]|nr:hypothetical protein [Bacteroidia bacterium]MDW8088955.1 choice-of-anchor Q domain-containing protein [Bacteroidia bacterium]